MGCWASKQRPVQYKLHVSAVEAPQPQFLIHIIDPSPADLHPPPKRNKV
ncbi:hypothetical protein [Bacillus subtilis]|nr:hypothetical protein [Bacillus subtilis]MEC0454813.1 hypothetical protein [Bacillus subtilis]BAI83712.2 hypothetical protein BSNT_06573 [Bacillus subtilis subsp. natto BEST195]